MKKTRKAILDALAKDGKKGGRFEMLILNLALQKIDTDSFEFDGEAVYTVDRKTLVYCLSNKESFTIPEGVTVIGNMGFRNKKHLKNVIIPSTVKLIDRDAFYDCDDLDNVFIPKSVDTIRAFAFAECDKLKTVTFEGAPAHLSRHTFEESEDLHRVIVPAGKAPYFQKALHYDEVDDDYLIIERQEETEQTAEPKPVPELPKDKEKPMPAPKPAGKKGKKPAPEKPKAKKNK